MFGEITESFFVLTGIFQLHHGFNQLLIGRQHIGLQHICIFLDIITFLRFGQICKLLDPINKRGNQIVGTEQWYVYDVQYEMENGQEFYIRGVVSVTETQKEFLIAVRFAVILLPLTVILTALIGYRLIRRTLLPVRQMTETVQEIQKDGDLSRRIGVSQDTGKDEFYQLAGTFDGMLESLEQAFLREPGRDPSDRGPEPFDREEHRRDGDPSEIPVEYYCN